MREKTTSSTQRQAERTVLSEVTFCCSGFQETSSGLPILRWSLCIIQFTGSNVCLIKKYAPS